MTRACVCICSTFVCEVGNIYIYIYRDFLQTYVKCPSSFWHVDLRLVDSPVQLYKASGCRGDDFWKMDKAAKAAILRVFGILSFRQVVKVDVWGKTSQVVSSAAKEQLTSGHISPFNDGQGFFAQFDPSKVRDVRDSPRKMMPTMTMNWRYQSWNVDKFSAWISWIDMNCG